MVQKERENVQKFKVEVSRHIRIFFSVVQNLFQLEGNCQGNKHQKGNQSKKEASKNGYDWARPSPADCFIYCELEV